MGSSSPVRFAVLLAAVCSVSAAPAQQLIGYVSTKDASVTGAKDEFDGQAVLAGSVGVTAKDHTAPITLGRGGTVRVCQTSELHVTENKAVTLSAPLLFSLDRGAIEIAANGTPTDAIMTPDLRFTVRNAGPLDLRMRVARNGDTCVENRGPTAPSLSVTDAFGESQYELGPGQHVLFEHGSLHEVVDRESTPCGCPESKGATVADALLASSTGPSSAPKADAPPPTPSTSAGSISATQAAEQHPFPAAISEGLAPVEPVPQVAQGEVHTQVTESLAYTGGVSLKDPDALTADLPDASGGSAPAGGAAAAAAPRVAVPAAKPPVQTASAPAPAPVVPAPAPPQPAPVQPAPPPAAAATATPHTGGAMRAIGRFFKRLFAG